MQIDRRAFTAGLGSFALSAATPARAQSPEKPALRLAVANKAHLYYLPVTMAERRGHFRDYGLTVTIVDFDGGSQSLEALLAGSVDVATAAYEHTLHAQAKGAGHTRVDRTRTVSRHRARRAQGPALQVARRPEGLKIGVTAPGSSTHFFVLYLMAKAGLSPNDATFVGRRRRRGGGRRDEERRNRRDLQPRSGDHTVAGGRRDPHRHRQPLSRA